MRTGLVSLMWVCTVVAVVAADPRAPTLDRDAKGFRYVDTDKDGQPKCEIVGGSLSVPPKSKGVVVIKDLKVTLFEKGRDVMKITSPMCEYDARQKMCSSTSDVCVARAEFMVTGRGYRCYLDEKKLEIFDKARVALKNIREQTNVEAK